MRSSVVLAGSALFLGGAGAAQVALEALAYFAGAGPYAAVFGGSPYTIGFVEAHGLAVLIAAALARAARAPTPGAHAFAAAVHLLLGSANVLFWPAFVVFGVVAQGAVATGIHGAFLLLNAGAAWAQRTTPGRPAESPLPQAGRRQPPTRARTHTSGGAEKENQPWRAL